MCFTVMCVGLRSYLYLLSQCLYLCHLDEYRFEMASALAFTVLYVVHCDECRTEIAHVIALTVFICVSP